jgi:DNA-binding IclR family transcriptional regulator
MSKTLLRGLDLIEEVGRHGPMTVTELARRTGVHITIVSRTIKACEPEGWLVRVDGKVLPGPRCALLGLTSPVSRTIGEAEPLVRAIAAVTGLAASADGLVGSDLMMLTSFGAAGAAELAGALSRVPIYVLAAGRAVAAQLPAERLDAVLPAEPFPGVEQLLASLNEAAPTSAYLAGFHPEPDPGAAVPRTRAELEAELEEIRSGGFARDHGGIHPSIHCIAAPWPTDTLPAAFACFGSRERIEADAALIESTLRAATKPGATAQDVLDAASAARSPNS